MSTYTATATIDLAALRANLARLRTYTDVPILAAVKADAYGHGLIPIARAAAAGGADWLGTAQLSEALAMRAAGITAPILAWLFTPHTDLLADCIAEDIDLSGPDVWGLDLIAEAAARVGRVARVHLEIDTGMSRGGVRIPEFEKVVTRARALEEDGHIRVVGLWTHLACADEIGHPSIAAQYSEYERALALAGAAGLDIQVRHIANSAATLTGLEHYDLVRPGLACYGLSPIEASPAELGLRPIMRVTAELSTIKDVPAGTGISYGHTHIAPVPTRVGVVPLGYGDGIPRHASNNMTVSVRGTRVPIVGRVCMDQFMIDLGDLDARPGDEVVILGPGDDGEPTAAEWATAAGTIDYEIITRLGPRIPRVHINGEE